MKKAFSFWSDKAQNNSNNATNKSNNTTNNITNNKAKDAVVKNWSKYTPEVVPIVAPQRDPTKETIGLKVTSSNVQQGKHTKTAGVDSVESFVHVSINCGPGTTRTPLDVCCVVDVSGSMGDPASIKDETGKTEGHGLSILDVVKHSVKTIIQALEPCDRVAVIAFESSPHKWFPLTQATDTNKEYLEDKVDQMRTMGGTDLWKGLEAGMDLLQEVAPAERAQRLPTLLVLTDGIPDYNPEGYLKKYKDTHKVPNMNTFGFGYNLQTPVLLNIASEGSGMHAFIPDASFVGTAFVNAISNLMVTNSTNVTLSLEPENGLKIEEVLGHQSQETSWGRMINMCTLQYGQTKDAVVRVSRPKRASGDAEANAEPLPSLVVTLKYESAIDPKEHTIEAQCDFTADNGGTALEVHKLRLTMAQELWRITSASDFAHTQKSLSDMAASINDPHAKGIHEDIKGQVKEAIEAKYYGKWGQHYLPSLSRAHLLQQCNNFKDPGIQFYGGDIFHTLRDKIEDIFVKLPPPKPSKKNSSYYGGSTSSSSSTSAPLASMSAYYNAAGGCIAGECLVSMADGSQKRIDKIIKGDKVTSSTDGAGSNSQVVCVVKTHCFNGRESLVTLPGGLRLTPYHPVRKDGAWQFPLNIEVPHRDTRCDFVYNFVLQGETHAMVVNDMECVTLGHGMEGPVVAHPYFGTQRVVDDLRTMNGFEHGCVELYPSGGKTMVRDEKSGLVCGFVNGVDALPISGKCEL